MQGYCDVFKWTLFKRTSTEVKYLYPTSSRRYMCTSSVSNVIYHKFPLGAAFYTVSVRNVNVMFESYLSMNEHSRELSKIQGGHQKVFSLIHLDSSVHHTWPLFKLTTSLVNVSLNFQKLFSQICQYFC